MYYVYILRSIKFPGQYYTGFTLDLNSRIRKTQQWRFNRCVCLFYKYFKALET
jgi:predicted GIY-YIG superfamily endonuclease